MCVSVDVLSLYVSKQTVHKFEVVLNWNHVFQFCVYYYNVMYCENSYATWMFCYVAYHFLKRFQRLNVEFRSCGLCPCYFALFSYWIVHFVSMGTDCQ